MRISVETVDDALLTLYGELLHRTSNVVASRGRNTEILGVLIEIDVLRIFAWARRPPAGLQTGMRRVLQGSGLVRPGDHVADAGKKAASAAHQI